MDECKHKYYGRDGRGNVTYGPICHSQPVTEDCPGEEHCVGFQSDRAVVAEAELAAGTERVVEVEVPPGYAGIAVRWNAGGPWPGAWHYNEGSEPPGRYEVIVRGPLPDPKPLARPWLLATGKMMCAACHCRSSRGWCCNPQCRYHKVPWGAPIPLPDPLREAEDGRD